MKRTLTMLLAVIFAFSCLALAQEGGPPQLQANEPGPAGDDGPGRAVARISLSNGDVSIRRGDAGDWVAAAINAPLLAGDHVLTGNGRAEIQFDYANMLRLDSNAEVRLAELENRHYEVQVARGMVMLAVIRDSDANMEVDTPNISIRPAGQGMYRITVTEDGFSEVTVRAGEVEAFGPRGVERVYTGRTMLVRGPASDPEFQMVVAAGPDNWDRWNDERDRRLEQSRSYQYVSRDIYGADDLDAYGRWVNVPPYGQVWSPTTVGPEWAPYRDGRWAWVDDYGWTWIDYDPWGWAPFHYGRWFWGAPYGWCWFPGPVYAHYYWRPALVAFLGFGRGIGVGFGFGSIGWVPLAPYEPFYPWYGRGWYGGFRTARIVNNTNITNIYRNARVMNGVSVIGAAQFVRGGAARPIGISNAALHSASQVRGPVPLTPVRESLRVANRQIQTAALSRAASPQRFASFRQAPAVNRVPFDQQRRGMEQMVNRAFTQQSQFGSAVRAGQPDGSGWRQLPQAGSAPRAGNFNRGSTNWRTFGASPGSAPRTSYQPRGSGTSLSGYPQFAPPGRASNGNWQRFGTARDSGSMYPRSGQRYAPSAAPRWSQSRSEPIRINPPIVRQRAEFGYTRQGGYSHGSPGGGSHGGGGGGGGGHGGGGHGGGGHGR